jgi:hypothetical protein
VVCPKGPQEKEKDWAGWAAQSVGLCHEGAEEIPAYEAASEHTLSLRSNPRLGALGIFAGVAMLLK